MILTLMLQSPSILTRRHSHVVPQQDIRSHGAKFHQCQVFANATPGSSCEGSVGAAVLDELRLTVPPLGYEFVRADVDRFIWEKFVSGMII